MRMQRLSRGKGSVKFPIPTNKALDERLAILVRIRSTIYKTAANLSTGTAREDYAFIQALITEVNQLKASRRNRE